MHDPRISLNDGTTIPALGLGVWQVDDDTAERVVSTAIEAGYRHVDTAAVYGNEGGVGRAIAAAALPRAELTVTTKLWNADQGYETTLAACERSLERLGLDQIDVYLIHWAMPARRLFVDTWRAFLELRAQGLVRTLGVSNFPVECIDEITAVTGAAPALNQLELHPYFSQVDVRRDHDERGIRVGAWSPLGQGGPALADPSIAAIAAQRGVSPAQVILAWHRALGTIAVPKSVTPGRIRENLASLDVTLTDAEVTAITALDRADGRIGVDPRHANHLVPGGGGLPADKRPRS